MATARSTKRRPEPPDAVYHGYRMGDDEEAICVAIFSANGESDVRRLEIALAPERLDEGSPEERACFGLFSVRCGANELTAGVDHFPRAFARAACVRVSCRRMVRLELVATAIEPRSSTQDWWRAHKMSAIGEGYAWPNLTIFSDGVRTVLVAKPSAQVDAKPFRYLGSCPSLCPRHDLRTLSMVSFAA